MLFDQTLCCDDSKWHFIVLPEVEDNWMRTWMYVRERSAAQASSLSSSIDSNITNFHLLYPSCDHITDEHEPSDVIWYVCSVHCVKSTTDAFYWNETKRSEWRTRCIVTNSKLVDDDSKNDDNDGGDQYGPKWKHRNCRVLAHARLWWSASCLHYSFQIRYICAALELSIHSPHSSCMRDRTCSWMSVCEADLINDVILNASVTSWRCGVRARSIESCAECTHKPQRNIYIQRWMLIDPMEQNYSSVFVPYSKRMRSVLVCWCMFRRRLRVIRVIAANYYEPVHWATTFSFISRTSFSHLMETNGKHEIQSCIHTWRWLTCDCASICVAKACICEFNWNKPELNHNTFNSINALRQCVNLNMSQFSNA